MTHEYSVVREVISCCFISLTLSLPLPLYSLLCRTLLAMPDETLQVEELCSADRAFYITTEICIRLNTERHTFDGARLAYKLHHFFGTSNECFCVQFSAFVNVWTSVFVDEYLDV